MSLIANPEKAKISELYAACVQGDREAFAEIVRRHQNMVTAVTFSMTGNVQQSEDLAQETFVAAWQNFQQLREPGKLPAWLCGIARNLTHKWLRKTKLERQSQCETSLENIAESVEKPNPNREEQAALLWATIQNIPEKYREPLVMYYRQEQSIPQIATALKISEDNARQRIARGRAFLKEEVQKQVESALEQLKPNPAFTLTVLAALPTVSLLSASTAFAGTATASTTVGSGIAGKGTALAGVGFFSWFIGIIWLGLGSVVIPLLALFGGFKTAIQQVQNSPTVRSRRLMIRNTTRGMGFAFFLMGAYFFVVSFPAERLSLTPKLICIIVLAYFFFFFNIILGGFWTNQSWRKIIEEDLGRRPAPKQPLEESWLSVRTLRGTFFGSLLLLGLGQAGFLAFVWQLTSGFPAVWFQRIFFYGMFFVTILPVVLFINTYRKTMKMATETGLTEYPPAIPNVLDVVLGKAEMPSDKKTLRARIGGDMIGMGILVFSGSVQPVMLGLMQPNPWPAYLVIGVSIIGFALFALLVAGKPKVRHLGWMLTSLFFTGFYAWILWGGVFQKQFAAIPQMELAVLFIYCLFFFSGMAAFLGFVGLFEKEVNRKLGN